MENIQDSDTKIHGHTNIGPVLVRSPIYNHINGKKFSDVRHKFTLQCYGYFLSHNVTFSTSSLELGILLSMVNSESSQQHMEYVVNMIVKLRQYILYTCDVNIKISHTFTKQILNKITI
jgi:hypothetical protein